METTPKPIPMYEGDHGYLFTLARVPRVVPVYRFGDALFSADRDRTHFEFGRSCYATEKDAAAAAAIWRATRDANVAARNARVNALRTAESAARETRRTTTKAKWASR